MAEKQKPDVSINIGRTVRLLRETQNLSGVDLCRKSGLDPKTLTAVEKGRIKNPSIQTLELLARGLDTTVSSLFRHAELGSEKHFLRGTQKGISHIQIQSGVELVSFTPFNPQMFCGKFVLGGRKTIDRSVIQFDGVVFAMTLVGHFKVRMENHELELPEGENIYFRGTFDFSFSNTQHRNSVLMVVTVPSFFGGASPF